jgi:hypothetical protein
MAIRPLAPPVQYQSCAPHVITQQANSVEHDVPVSHRETVDCVPKHLQCFDGRPGLVAHDVDMWFPFEATVYEEPEVSQGFHQPHHIVGAHVSVR